MSIGGISSGAASSYLFAAIAADKPEADDETASTSNETGTRADRERGKLGMAQSALETIKQFNKPSDRDAERKARAKQKIATLKARFQMLQMMRPISTRALAELARQLKAAMGEFGKASSSDGSVVSPQGNEGDVETAPTSAPIAAEDANEAGSVADANIGKSDISSAGDPLTDEEGDPKSDAKGKAHNTVAQDNNLATAAYRRTAGQSEQVRRNEQSRTDKEFLADVRNLATRIKALAKEAAKKDLQGRHDTEDAISAATGAAREAQRAGQDLGTVSLSIMA